MNQLKFIVLLAKFHFFILYVGIYIFKLIFF